VPGCRPSIVNVPPPAWVRVLVIEPGVDVAVYEVITAPPFEAGATKATVAVRLPVAVARTDAGASGALIAGALFAGSAAANGEKLVVTPQTWPSA